MSVTNALGRRKTSVARVYLKKGKGKITVNNREVSEYFPTVGLRAKALAPLDATDNNNAFDINANIKGGGVAGQADAVDELARRSRRDDVRADGKPTQRREGGGETQYRGQSVVRLGRGQRRDRARGSEAALLVVGAPWRERDRASWAWARLP